MSTPNRFTLTCNAQTFLVERAGTGPTVLVINGSGGTLDGLRPFLQKVQKYADTISFDNRGMGGSSVPEGPWEMADYAKDVKSVLDELGITSCIVLGISFGGMIAQEFAVTYPTYVSKLVLWCTSAGGSAGSSYPLHELAKLSPEELASFAPRLVDMRFTPEWLADHPSDRALMPAPPTPTEQLVSVTALQHDARSRHDVADRLGALTMPLLLGAGVYDLMAPVVNAEAIAQRVGDATLHTYQGGHLFFFQDPKAFGDVQAFVEA